jgi:hypothetical protein
LWRESFHGLPQFDEVFQCLPCRFWITPLPLRTLAVLEAGPPAAAAVRSHWGAQNNLHWIGQVVFHDDLARLRTGSRPHNKAVIKHMAMKMTRNAGDPQQGCFQAIPMTLG